MEGQERSSAFAVGEDEPIRDLGRALPGLLPLRRSRKSVASSPAGASPPRTPQPIVITGSALPTTPDQVTVPVTIVDSTQIQKAGVSTNVLEILRKQVPSFEGAAAPATATRPTTISVLPVVRLSSCAISIRLVLVNGRRVAPSAISGINGKIFVNVSEIPPDAIDHIEVLTDGASAIYGSDAIGGVVNIILKSNWHGGQVNARYGGADGYNERNVGLTYGADVLPSTNVTRVGQLL